LEAFVNQPLVQFLLFGAVARDAADPSTEFFALAQSVKTHPPFVNKLEFLPKTDNFYTVKSHF
jgi:hypothetical protein